MKYSNRHVLLASMIGLIGFGSVQASATERVRVKVKVGVMKCEASGTSGCHPVKMKDPKIIEIELTSSNPDMAPGGSWASHIEVASTIFSFGIQVDKFENKKTSEAGYYFSLGAKDNRSKDPHLAAVQLDYPYHLNQIMIQGKSIVVGGSTYYPAMTISSP